MRFHFFSLLAVIGFATPCFSQDWEWLYREEAGSTGTSRRAYHGTAIVGVGDVNGDSFADYAASARGTSTYAPFTGGVKVISGADGSILATFVGDDPYEGAGYSLAFLGVQSISGSADAAMLAIGSPFASSTEDGLWSGRVYLIDASSGTPLDSINGVGGVALLGAGLTGVDHNGDGILDLAVSSVGDSSLTGKVDIFTWDGTSLIKDSTLVGVDPGGLFGYSLASLGNRDGSPDGTEEYLIGTPFASPNNQFRGGRISTSDSALSLTSGSAGGLLGWSVDTADFNLDGILDIAVGEPRLNRAHIWRGNANTGSLPSYTFEGPEANSQFGSAVAWVGDTTFDTVPDLAIGAPFTGAMSEGQVVVFDIANVTAITNISDALYGTIPGARAGQAIAGIGDTNGTGHGDLAVGVPRYGSQAPVQNGAVFIWASPDEDVEGITLDLSSLAGGFEPGTDAQVDLSNLKSSCATGLYVGTGQSLSGDAVTFEGQEFTLNLTGATFVDSNLSASESASFVNTIDAGAANGQEFFLQAVEISGDYLRVSEVDSYTVVIQNPFTLTMTPSTLTVGQPLVLTATNGYPEEQCYFFYSFIAPGFGNDPGMTNSSHGNDFTISDTGLFNPQNFFDFGRTNNQPFDNNGEASMTFPSWPAATSGGTFWFSAIAVDGNGVAPDLIAAIFAGPVQG